MRSRREGCSFAFMRASPWLPALLLAPLVLVGCHGGSDKAGGTAAGKTTVLTLAVPFGQPTEVNGFAEEISRLSHRTMRIAVTPRWRYGQIAYEKGLIADVRAGKADLGAAGSRAWDSVGVNSLRALGVPFLIDSYALQDRVLASPMIPVMLHGLRSLGLVGLGVLPSEMRRPLAVTHALLGPSDYARRKFGVQQSLVASSTMRALGARPVWFGGGASIAQFDGIEYTVSDIQASRYDGPGKDLTSNVVLWPRPVVLFASRAAYARLSPAQRRILKQAVADDRTAETNAMVRAERADTEILCGRRHLRFVTASSADIAALRTAVRPVYAQLERDPQTRRFIAEIQALRAQVGAPTAKVPNCQAGASVSAPAGATPVDGVYAVTVDPRDLPASQRLPEAYGSWQLVLDRGRFRFRQSSDGADWVGVGRLRVRGDEMGWTVAWAGDWGPHGAPDGVPLKSHDVLLFRWERKKGALRLEPRGAGPALPALFARPLTRVTDAPGQQALENPRAIEGSWAGNATAGDVITHHGDPNGIADNTGPLRLTVHDRRCRWTQHAPDGDHWGVGTCRFAGDTIELDMKRTDDSASPFPFFLRWSVFHDRLSFRQTPGPSPEAWTYRPWRKVR
jgi:TRAP-type C4-dicarboxylate transport system substrate-binding protein